MQAHDEPQHQNTNAPWLLDCVYLLQVENSQGDNKLLHLQTNKFVKLWHLTKMPTTPIIIKQMHVLETLDDMPQGLKITNEENNIIPVSDWIVGLDYGKEFMTMINMKKNMIPTTTKIMTSTITNTKNEWKQVSRYSTRAK